MSKIKIERRPSPGRLQELGVFRWPIWTKEVSKFPWTYDSQETCYFLEGEVTVTCADGEKVTVGQGDLVTFPAGMSCTWKITKDVKKHYTFG
ncbi:MAG: cupin domain-containing protein [Deltaproteobacteria bacterium]|nr:cupin domain-containing protein [Deltaproteobacteria bacterium]